VKLCHCFSFLCVAAAAVCISSTAARADSIPTLTATSASFSRTPVLNWSLSGDSFSVSGASGFPSLGIADGTPGSPIALYFHEVGGATVFTEGTLTLDGVSHRVLLEQSVHVLSDTGYNPTVTGPTNDPSGNVLGVTDTLPATVTGFGTFV
jgi:hypothetical protein